MTHETFDTKINTFESDFTFESVYPKAWFPLKLKKQIF